MNEILIPHARTYTDRNQLELAETLGSGKDGIVFVANNKANSADVAIKILRFEDAYRREKGVYQRLEKNAVKSDATFAGSSPVSTAWRRFSRPPPNQA